MSKHAFRSHHPAEKDTTLKSTQRASIFLAKNNCWYCGEPLDSIRRYCDKSCAEAFEEDDHAMTRRILDHRLHLPA
jgi:hypothetical protein